jgi:cytochrome P450
LTLLAGPTGLFTIEGKAHSVQRKTIQKVFTNTAVRNLTPTLWRKCINLGDEIQKRMNRTGKDDVTLDIQPLSAGATLDITAMLLFGKDTNCLEDEEEPMQKAWGLLTKPKATDGHLTFYFILQMLLPRRYADSLDGKFSRRFKSAVSDLRAYCLDIVTQRRNELQSEEKIDVLSLMLAEEKAFVNDDEVVDQLTTFLAAG